MLENIDELNERLELLKILENDVRKKLSEVTQKYNDAAMDWFCIDFKEANERKIKATEDKYNHYGTQKTKWERRLEINQKMIAEIKERLGMRNVEYTVKGTSRKNQKVTQN